MALSGEEVSQLSSAMLSAFTRSSLEQLLRYRLDKSLEEISGGRNPAEVVVEVIRWADASGRTTELVQAAREHNPGNPELLRVAEHLGLMSLTPDLERTVRRSQPHLDIEQWRSQLGEAEPRVCRIEVG